MHEKTSAEKLLDGMQVVAGNIYNRLVYDIDSIVNADNPISFDGDNVLLNGIAVCDCNSLEDAIDNAVKNGVIGDITVDESKTIKVIADCLFDYWIDNVRNKLEAGIDNERE